jgi:hypothetical protein
MKNLVQWLMPDIWDEEDATLIWKSKRMFCYTTDVRDDALASFTPRGRTIKLPNTMVEAGHPPPHRQAEARAQAVSSRMRPCHRTALESRRSPWEREGAFGKWEVGQPWPVAMSACLVSRIGAGARLSGCAGG